MNLLGRLTVLALLCGVGGPMAGCAVRGSSFETLGVPTPEQRRGRSAVIIGWAREQREGWSIKRVRIDEVTRAEWNEDTQEPTIIYLEPGEHQLQLYTAQLSDPRDPSSRARRRYKVRPLQLDLLEAEAQLCVARLSEGDRVRPQVRCEAHEVVATSDDEYGDDDEGDYEDEDEDDYDDEYADEDDVVEAAPVARAGSAATTEPQPAPGGVPSPFGQTAPVQAVPRSVVSPSSAQPDPAPSPPQQPAATPAAPATSPSAPAAGQPPRRLSLEDRVERLERQLEEIMRLLRNQR